MEYIDSLKHYGVPGMKWGHRKSRVSGSKATKKTPSKESEKPKNGLLSKIKNKNKSSDKAVSKTKPKTKQVEEEKPKQKSVKEMSDAELNSKINRIRLEQQYKQLNPKQVSKGKKYATAIGNTVVKDMLVPAAVDIGKQLIKSGGVKYVNEKLELPEEFKVFTNNKKK